MSIRSELGHLPIRFFAYPVGAIANFEPGISGPRVKRLVHHTGSMIGTGYETVSFLQWLNVPIRDFRSIGTSLVFYRHEAFPKLGAEFFSH